MKVFASFCVFATLVVACSIAVAAPSDSQPGFRFVSDSLPCETPPDNCLSDNCPTDNSVCESSCAGDLCGCADRPLLDAQVSWLYMWRTKPDNTDIFLTPNGTPVVGGRDFNLGPTSGIDATLIYRRPCGGAFDVRYLWIDAFTDTTAFTVPVGTSLINTTPNSTFLGPADLPGEYRYMSRLQTAEVNVRKEFCYFDWLFGFRYADFRESLDGNFTFSGLPETQTWRAGRNNLYGFQTGVDAVLWEPICGLQIGAIGKAGIYYNDIRTDFNTSFFRTPTDPVTASASTSKAAFLGEVGLNATYRINCHFALRGGYQMLWLSGVATAVDQVPATSNFNATPGTVIDSRVNGDSSVFYHGVNAGLEYTW